MRAHWLSLCVCFVFLGGGRGGIKPQVACQAQPLQVCARTPPPKPLLHLPGQTWGVCGLCAARPSPRAPGAPACVFRVSTHSVHPQGEYTLRYYWVSHWAPHCQSRPLLPVDYCRLALSTRTWLSRLCVRWFSSWYVLWLWPFLAAFFVCLVQLQACFRLQAITSVPLPVRRTGARRRALCAHEPTKKVPFVRMNP